MDAGQCSTRMRPPDALARFLMITREKANSVSEHVRNRAFDLSASAKGFAITVGAFDVRVEPDEADKATRIVRFHVGNESEIECFDADTKEDCKANEVGLLCSHVEAAIKILLGVKFMRTWQESILQTIEMEDGPGWQFHYTMPRQIGTTTFLVLFANREVKRGKKVAYLAPNFQMLRNVRAGWLDPFYEMFPVGPLDDEVRQVTALPDGLEAHFDWLVLDNMRYANPKIDVDLMKTLLKPGGRVLWIDTVEDERAI
jgi:hypothetical protein